MRTSAGLCLCLVILISCEGGLTVPPDIEPGIVGLLTAPSSWPSQTDSVKTLWIFASQIYPLDSSKVVAGIFNSQILLYPALDQSLPYGFTSLDYNFPLTPATYYYIGVLQRFGDNVVDPRSYRVVGVYENPQNPSEPGVITIREFQVLTGINIMINFVNPPPQPF